MPREKHIQISIPQPCTEGRKTMERAGENLFCGQCQKVITDFSRLSDVEIGRIMAQPNPPTCGRFRRDQLDRAITFVPAAQRSWPRLAAGAMLLVLAMPHALLAQAPQNAQLSASASTIQAEDGAEPVAAPPSPAEDSIFALRGHLIQSYSGFPLSDASVAIINPHLEVQTNDSGYFALMIPRSMLQDTMQLEVAWEGDVHAIAVSIDRQQSSAQVTLALEMRAALLDGVMIMDRPVRALDDNIRRRGRR